MKYIVKYADKLQNGFHIQLTLQKQIRAQVNSNLKNWDKNSLMILEWMKIKFSGDAQELLQIKSKIRIFGNVILLKW